MIIFDKNLFFVAKTKKSGVVMIASSSVGFYVFIYILYKNIFILISYSMASFLGYNETTLFQFFGNIKNNLNFSGNSIICIFFIKNE